MVFSGKKRNSSELHGHDDFGFGSGLGFGRNGNGTSGTLFTEEEDRLRQKSDDQSNAQRAGAPTRSELGHFHFLHRRRRLGSKKDKKGNSGGSGGGGGGGGGGNSGSADPYKEFFTRRSSFSSAGSSGKSSQSSNKSKNNRKIPPTTSKIVKLRYLKPGAMFHYRIWSDQGTFLTHRAEAWASHKWDIFAITPDRVLGPDETVKFIHNLGKKPGSKEVDRRRKRTRTRRSRRKRRRSRHRRRQ